MGWVTVYRWADHLSISPSHSCQLSLLPSAGWEMSTSHRAVTFCSWGVKAGIINSTTTTITTVLWPFFRDHPDEPVPKENFWTLWYKGRLTEADTPTIQLGATPSRLTSSHLHHPLFFTDGMPFLPPNQQCKSTKGN